MDTAETAELRNSLRAMFAAATAAEPAAVSAQLHELGWDEVVADEPGAAALLFEEHGRALASSTVLDEAVAAALGLQTAGTAVAYPMAAADPLWEPCLSTQRSSVGVDAVLRTAGQAPERIVLPVNATEVFVVPAAELDLRAVNGLDPHGSWTRVTCEWSTDPACSVSGRWGEAVAVGRRLLAAESVGLARRALALATSHVSERHQFGRPIGSFQAVRFRLAETKVAIEAAAEAVRVAFADESALAAVVAKVLAARAAESAVRHAAQVCGAMGMTWEFGLHRVIRRSFVLDQLLGDSHTLTSALGRYLAESATLPQLDPLVVPLTR